MSLNIECSFVTAVLLADGWSVVEPGSFEIDAYEFVEEWYNQQWKARYLGPDGSGFFFRVGDQTFMGPVSAIFAVKYDQEAYNEWRKSLGAEAKPGE